MLSLIFHEIIGGSLDLFLFLPLGFWHEYEKKKKKPEKQNSS